MFWNSSQTWHLMLAMKGPKNMARCLYMEKCIRSTPTVINGYYNTPTSESGVILLCFTYDPESDTLNKFHGGYKTMLKFSSPLEREALLILEDWYSWLYCNLLKVDWIHRVAIPITNLWDPRVSWIYSQYRWRALECQRTIEDCTRIL